MVLKELAVRLGIVSYPDLAEAVYATLPEDDGALFCTEYIRALEAEHGLLGEFLPLVEQGAAEVAADADLALWARLALSYIRTASESDVRRLPMPEPDGTVARDILPVLVLLQEVPAMVEGYRARGFQYEGETGIRSLLSAFHGTMHALITRRGRPMLDQLHFNWLLYYTRCSIFRHKAFQFQEARFPSAALLLRHRESGEYRFVMAMGRFHKSGRVLGSAAYTDEDGAFNADLLESDTAFTGHPVVDDLVSPRAASYPKDEWECVLRGGDDVVSIHIPSKANLTPEYVEESLREGLAMTRSYYPDRRFRALICTSWMLDPILPAFLGEDSRLAKFNRLFLKYPIRDYGKAVFNFVFPGYADRPLADLPEDTSLQRKIKAYMQGGHYIYTTSGVITASLEW